MNSFSFNSYLQFHYLSVDQNQKNNNRNDRKTKPGPFGTGFIVSERSTPALLSWAMKALSSFLHRGVFHFRLSISPRPGKVIQLSSLQMPAPQKETSLLRKPSDSAIVQQKQKYRHLAKMCFPKQPRVIFSCTVSATKLHIICESKGNNSSFLSCSCLCITLYSTVYLSQSNLFIEKNSFRKVLPQ